MGGTFAKKIKKHRSNYNNDVPPVKLCLCLLEKRFILSYIELDYKPFFTPILVIIMTNF